MSVDLEPTYNADGESEGEQQGGQEDPAADPNYTAPEYYELGTDGRQAWPKEKQPAYYEESNK